MLLPVPDGPRKDRHLGFWSLNISARNSQVTSNMPLSVSSLGWNLARYLRALAAVNAGAEPVLLCSADDFGGASICGMRSLAFFIDSLIVLSD